MCWCSDLGPKEHTSAVVQSFPAHKVEYGRIRLVIFGAEIPDFELHISVYAHFLVAALHRFGLS
jgi:hypothetical protein